MAVQTITMSDLHLNPGEIVNRVHYGHEPVAVLKHGQPVVILVPVIGALDGSDGVVGAVRRWLESLEPPAQTWEQHEPYKGEWD